MLTIVKTTLPRLLIILLCIIFAELILMSIALQGVPNNIQFTAADNFSFYLDLFRVNPSAATKLSLVDNPVFIIQQLGDVNANEVWGVYFMPIQIVFLITLSALINRAINLKFNACRWSQIGIASSLLLSAILYLRLQTCCTAAPRWVFDIWLISQINDPRSDQTYWQNLYTQLAEHFTLMQFSIATIGCIILYLIFFTDILCRDTKTSL